MASGPDTLPHNSDMSLTNGHGHTRDNYNTNTSSQALGGDSPLSVPGDFADDTLSAIGYLSNANGNEDSVMHDMATSDIDDDDEDAMCEDDDDYDEDMQEQAIQYSGKRLSLSSESSIHSSKRKRGVDEEDEYMQANPELYGLRRSGRAKPPPQFAESSDEDEDVVVRNGRKRQKARRSSTARSSRRSTAALSGRDTSPEDSEDDDDDVYGGARARAKAKKHRRKAHSGTSGNGTPLNGEVRFSTRRTAKVTNYNEDARYDQDDVEEDDSAGHDSQEKADDQPVVPKIELVLNHRLKQDAAAGSEDHDDYQFLIKWYGKAHYHATWEDWQTLSLVNGWRRRDNYYRKIVMLDIEMTHDPDTPPEEREQWLLDRETKFEELSQWSKVERVMDRRRTTTGTEYYVKWKALQYEYGTWEQASLLSEIAQDAVDHYLDRASRLPASDKKESNPATRSTASRLYSQPAYIKGGTLREFQLTGLNFLIFQWCKGNNVILADEMGLGKTVQTVSFCNWLFHNRGQEGPFLITVPLSTLPAWQETFALWAPDLNLVVYNGNDPSRKIIQAHEMFLDGNPRKIKFNVLLTTYEFVNSDVEILSHVKWQFLAVDEAHRLKNRDSLLYANLLRLNAPSRLLITGTPMQNQLSELSALMDFLMPGKIHVDPKLDLTDADATTKITALTAAIAPYMIRRTKSKVESDLPPKTEKIIRIELSDTQLDLYQNIIARNFAALDGDGPHKSSLLNVVMELKKASNHAFMFPNTEERILRNGELTRHEHLKAIIQNSGKMIVLDRLLTKLKQEGHRVLIFSQMVGLLNILGDYLGLRGHQYQRLDGTIPSAARKLAIDHFNAPESNDFAFLLSTRAGGLGINLMTADTVILFDSDWNPQADLQAMARAHRIGQKKPVSVYRFVSKDTIEEEILERARNKLMLEYLTIQRGVTDNDAGTKELTKEFEQAGKRHAEPTTALDISRILKKRGQKMFEQSGNQKKLEELDIDDVLANAELHNTEEREAMAADGGAEFLRSFEYTDVSFDDVSWTSIIPKDQVEKMQAEESERANQEYLDAVIEQNAPRKRKAAEESRDQRAAKKRARTLTAEAAEDDSSDDDSSGDPARALNEKESRNLIKAFERYGSIDEMEKEVVREARLVNRDISVVKTTLQQILDKADELLEEEKQRIKDLEQATNRSATKKDRKTVLFDFNGVKRLNAETLKERPEDLSMIRSEVKGAPNELAFRVSEASKAAAYTSPWGAREDGMLLVGIARHGYGAWTVIRDDPELGLEDKLFLEEHRIGNKTARTEAEDKKNAKSPGAVHLVRRTAYLISVLRDKTSGGADEQAKKALDNHHRNNRKTGGANARISTPQNGSASPMTRPSKNGDRAKDQKNPADRHEKLSTTNGISKSTHSKEPAKSVKRRLSDERASSKRRLSSARPPAVEVDETVTWDADRFNTLFAPINAALIKLAGAKARNFKTKQDQLTVLKKGILTVGDHIAVVCKRNKNLRADDLWKHVAYFHWPKDRSSALDNVVTAMKTHFKKMAGQRAELDEATPTGDKKSAEPSTPAEGEQANAQLKRTGSSEHIPANGLPSFQRAPRQEGVPKAYNERYYRYREDDRRSRHGRDFRRTRSRSPRRERTSSPPAEKHRASAHRELPQVAAHEAARKTGRDDHDSARRNGSDNYRPSNLGSERPSSSNHNDYSRRDHRPDSYGQKPDRPSSAQNNEQARRDRPSSAQNNDQARRDRPPSAYNNDQPRRDRRPDFDDGQRNRHNGHHASRRDERRDDRRDDHKDDHRSGAQDKHRHTGRDYNSQRGHRRTSSSGSNQSSRHDNRRIDSYRPPY